MRSWRGWVGAVLGAWLSLESSLASAQAPPVTVRGRVVDSESRQGVDQADVVLVGTDRRTTTDEQGRFVLEGVTPGTYTLSVLRLGFAPLRRQVTIAENTSPELDLMLARTAIPLAEVTVTPGTFSFMGQGTGMRQTMSREDVESVPQIGNDIFRAVNRLPGLVSNDYAAHFGVRGGRHDETLILLDGLELYEPYHLKDFNEGAISIIDAQTIDGVQLMTGGFPARYGNRRSGVFDIQSRTPDPEKAEVALGASFLNSHAMAMGPFAGGKGSWLAFGRTGYMGLVFQMIDQADLPQPEYGDAFGKLAYRFGPSQKLSFDILHAGDAYKYDIEATTGFLDTIFTREVADTKYGNSYAWSTLESAFGTKVTARTMLSGGIITRRRDGHERAVTQSAPYYRVTNDRRYTTYGLAQDWSLSLHENDLLSLGWDARQQKVRDDFESIVYQDPDDPEPAPPGEFPIITSGKFRKSGSRSALYASNRWRAFRPLVIETGLRWDQSTWTGDEDLSPRASAALDLGAGMTLRVGWGIYRQMQNIDEVATLNNNTTYYPSEKSEQWTAGWDRQWGKGSQLRIEGYWKRGSELRPVFRNWKGAVDAFPEPNEDRILVFPSENESKGVELYFDRPIGQKLTARASYSWAMTDEKVTRIDNVNSPDALTYSLDHPGPQDQRHAANMDVTYRLGSYVLNGSFAYHSGWPATHEHFIPAVNDYGEPDFAIRPLQIYGERLPDYMRFDVRAARKWTTGWGDFGASLEVINLTNNANVFGYDYFKIKDGNGNYVLERGEEQLFKILPSLGLTWTRRF